MTWNFIGPIGYPGNGDALPRDATPPTLIGGYGHDHAARDDDAAPVRDRSRCRRRRAPAPHRIDDLWHQRDGADAARMATRSCPCATLTLTPETPSRRAFFALPIATSLRRALGRLLDDSGGIAETRDNNRDAPLEKNIWAERAIGQVATELDLFLQFVARSC